MKHSLSPYLGLVDGLWNFIKNPLRVIYSFFMITEILLVKHCLIEKNSMESMTRKLDYQSLKITQLNRYTANLLVMARGGVIQFHSSLS